MKTSTNNNHHAPHATHIRQFRFRFAGGLDAAGLHGFHPRHLNCFSVCCVNMQQFKRVYNYLFINHLTITIMKTVKLLLISLFVLLSASTTWADIKINEKNFPNTNFRTWLLSQEYGKDGVLTDKEIASVEEIIVDSLDIKNMKGIEYFTALKKLSCSSNELAKLDVSKNTKLENIICSYNWLTAIDVSKNTELEELDCSSNWLTAIDVSKNTKLEKLECGINHLTALDVSKNTELEELDCGSNELKAIDVSNNTTLASLMCTGNELTTLDVSKNTELEYLSCNYNQLTALDVSKNSKLRSLDCSENQLTALDVSNNTKLFDLNCGRNQLTALDVSNNTKLFDLQCDQNQLKRLVLSGNAALNSLSCWGNELRNLNVSGCNSLTYLRCDQNGIGDSGMDALVRSLPMVSKGEMYVLNYLGEEVYIPITTAQVAAAKAKGWTVYRAGWIEYEGED